MTMTTRPMVEVVTADMAPRRRTMEVRRRQAIAELAAHRRATGLSQTDIAARMGTSQSAIARLETGDGDVRATTLERYAAAIGREITWFVRS
jgi:predicted transcriptional regulator